MTEPLAQLDATACAALVRSGEVSPLELVDAAVARIQAANPGLNAVIHPLFEQARDRARAAGSPPPGAGPFFGVPFLVKDALCQTAGDPYHLGMRFLKERDHRAETDSELAARFRRAGFVAVGRSNTPELAMSVTTEPLAYGATRNPWRIDHSPGGSSGGSAAAVAAGLVPAAHANDMGGSIRLPASFCGLVGLKPSRGRTSLAPDFGEYWGPLTHEHVLTRSVRDCAGVLDAVAGPAPGDPYTAPPPSRPFATEVDAEPGALRIGLVVEHPSVPVAKVCRVAVEEAGRALAEAGHDVEEVVIDSLARPRLGPWIQAGVARDLDRWSEHYGEPITEDDVEPLNWALAEAGRALSGPAYVAAAEEAFAWARCCVSEQLACCDVLVTPTAPDPPPAIGHCGPQVPVPQLLARLAAYTVFTMPFDVTGQPAISLPLGTGPEGLPIGVQLVAPYAREDRLLQLAGQLERGRPWADRRPDVYVD